MYHFWEFATAVADDIESMAERLHGPEHAPPALGRRRIFAAAAHPDVPPLPEQARAITMFGALRPTGPAATPLPPQPPQLTTRLADVVARRDTPELPPPLYGEWAADEHALPPTEDGWFGELNRTVAHRIASGLGAEVVRRNQETYVDAAWRQVGRIREANDLAARARLSAAVLGRLVQRHVASLPADRLLQAVAPVLGVTPGPPADLDDTSTDEHARRPRHVQRADRGDCRHLPAAGQHAAPGRQAGRAGARRSTTAPACSRLTAGPDGAALVETTPPTPDGIISLGDRDRLNVDPNDPAGGVPLAPLGLQGRTTAATVGRIVPETGRVPDLGGRELPFFPPSELPAVINMVTGRPRRRGGGIPIVRPPIRVTDQTATNAFDGAVAAMARSVDRAPPPVAFVGVDVAALGLQLLERLDPRRSVGRRVASMVVAPQPVDPFAGIMAFPILPEATYSALDALGGGWMLPSADGLEPDTAILLQTNPGFTAAFLVGMNHEMNAELLWRVYPTDQRGTPFQRFWDRDQGSIDIVPVHQWPLDQPLATAGAPPRLSPAAGTTNEQIVLLLRGQLLRRYPDMVVYAVKGTHAKPGTEVERQGRPVFAGRLSPDLNFVGFDMTAADLAADEWWFVLEQQLTAPRFGFDIEDLPAGDHVDVATLPGTPGTSDRVAAHCCSCRSASPCTVTASSSRWPRRDRARGHCGRVAHQPTARGPGAQPPRASHERRDDHRAGSRAVGAAAGAPRDPLRGAARCTDRAARAGLPGPDPRRRAPAGADGRRGGDRQDLLAASVGRWPRRRRTSGRGVDGTDPRRAAASGRAPRAGDDADERCRRPIPPSRTCPRRDASIDSPMALRALPERWVVVGRNEDGVEVLRKWFDRPVAPNLLASAETTDGPALATEEVIDQYLGWTADYPQALEAGMAVTITRSRRLRRLTAPRVQPPVRHRGSPGRRPRRADVAARQPRRHRWPRLPAARAHRPTTSTTRPPARRTWPTRRSRRQTSIVSGRPARSWRRRSASRWTRGRRSREPSTRSVGSHRRSSARRGPGRSATSPTSCSTPSSTTPPWIRPETTPGTSSNRSGRSERCASAASRSACCP